mmetsp:Transcript_34985/g.66839  ORF Transcript_34985/g.66839 Transcript_34985/m.66839 type:complete len:242 (+) Transcript_34985:467-1192(+)
MGPGRVGSNMPRPAQHGRHADTPFKEAEFGAPVGSRATPPSVRCSLNTVPVVGLKRHDGVVRESELVQGVQQAAYGAVGGAEEGAVHAARGPHAARLVPAQQLRVALVRVVRGVDCKVEEERLGCVCAAANEVVGLVSVQVLHELPSHPRLAAVLVQVVSVRPAPVVVVRVVVNAPAEVPEPPLEAEASGVAAEVPLAHVAGAVSVCQEHVRHGRDVHVHGPPVASHSHRVGGSPSEQGSS